MTSAYPGGTDDFGVPTNPEGTPLSEAGVDGRDHTQLHADTGAAIEKLEQYAAQRTHDHSGDATDTTKGAKLSQANTHQSADTDAGPASLHHTLGIGENQAAAGNHAHDYRSNFITNKPFEICTSTSRPEASLGKTIWEVDTNRMRVWAHFAGEQTAVQGLYSTDTFNRTSATDMGPMWEQTYVPYAGGTGHGIMHCDGDALRWTSQGMTYNRCIARRVNPADMHTQTDDQVIIFNTNSHVMSYTNPNPNNPAANDVYFRMSDDGQTYVRAALTWWKGAYGNLMLLYTNSGPTGEQLIGQLAAKAATPDIDWQLRLVGNTLAVYMGVEYVGEIVDPLGVTLTGYKGWGIGMQAGDPYINFWYYGWTQALPNEISEVTIADAPYFTSSAIWQLLPVGDVPRVGLGCTAPQNINPTGSLIEWGHVGEDNFGYFPLDADGNPVHPTYMVVSEPGVYHVHASIAWSPHLYGDHAGTIIVVNDLPTVHSHWEFVRGDGYTAGFSQTVDVTCYLRLAGGDRVAVAAAHNGAGSQWTTYKKTPIAPDHTLPQFSRFFMAFHSA